jgi:ABC-type lipoprotein release transport system permease subunit
MNNLLKLAGRNIWRNKRRTFITSASILFAVFFSIAVTSIQKGTWDHMVDSIVHYHFGYAQIHKAGYWEDKTIDNAFDPARPLEISGGFAEVRQLVPRIESFALASYGTRTKAAMVVGIDPEKERTLTRIDTRIGTGSYFAQRDDDGAILAAGLAEYLKLNVGDTLVMISQGYHGINAAGKFPVRGLVHFGSPELNKQLLYISLERAKWFYGTEGLITTLIVDTDAPDAIQKTVANLRQELNPEEYEVMDYKEMMPELIQAREVDTAGSYIILIVLYVIIAFGIFGTILMMLKEREYEFGILKAIGMRTGQLNLMVWLETILLGFIGSIAGMLVALPLVYYFHINPIRLSGQMAEAYEKFGVEPLLPAAVDPSLFISQAIVIFGMITVLSFYPMLKIGALKPVSAMRS